MMLPLGIISPPLEPQDRTKEVLNFSLLIRDSRSTFFSKNPSARLSIGRSVRVQQLGAVVYIAIIRRSTPDQRSHQVR